MHWNISLGIADGKPVPANKVRAAVERARDDHVERHANDHMSRTGDSHFTDVAVAAQFEAVLQAAEHLAIDMGGEVSVSIAGAVGERQDSVSISITRLA